MQKKKLLFLEKRKKEIDSYILKLVAKQKNIYQAHSASKPTFDYLEKFLNAGKTVRGGLFLEFANQLNRLSSKEIKKLLPIASAIEIIHSALLIQDDYMDQDDKRRGMTAFYNQRLLIANKKKLSNPENYAVGAMMCATDVVFFIAFNEIASVGGNKTADIFDFIGKEYAHVGFAQWKDLLLGKKQSDFTLEEIKTVYRYKTARYTFTMPVVLAGIISGLNNKQLKLLDEATENMGMVYQITDDYLSLFGNTEITGKNLGNDIVENKKTIYLHFLIEKLKKKENQKHRHVLNYFGKKNITLSEIAEVQNAILELKIVDKVEKMIDEYEKNLNKVLSTIDINDSAKNVLTEIFQFIKNRSK